MTGRRHINVSVADADQELAELQQPIRELALVGGAGELAALLHSLVQLRTDCNTSAVTLDLIGHSAGVDCLLLLGDWKIDGDDAAVRAFFAALARQRTLAQLGVESVRLLGCYTGTTPRARATLQILGDILGVEVCGTTCIVDRRCFDAGGLKRVYEDILWSAATGLPLVTLPPARSAFPD